MTIDGDSDHHLPTALEVGAFLCELAMFVLLCMAGWRLTDSTPTEVALLIALPVIVAIVWGIWLAPTSRRRLTNPARLVVQIILFTITAVLAASAGLLWWGISWALTSVAVFTALTRSDVEFHDGDGGVQSAGSPPAR